MSAPEGRSGATPLVSVVMVTNRHSPYLRAALESVAAQSFHDWEVVLVCDGCPDPGRLEAVASALPGRARLLVQPARGIGAGRNLGWAAAAGSLVTFLDDDDLWPAERLEHQVAALAARPEAIACYGEFLFVDADGQPFAKGWDSAGVQVSRSGAFHIGTVLVRRSALELAGGFDPLAGPHDDLDLNLHLGQLGPLVHLPEILLHYRRHDSNITGSPVALEFSRAIYRHHYALARLNGAEATARALLQRMVGQERHFALQAARAAAAAWRAGEWRSVAVEGRRAARGGALFTAALARRFACERAARPPAEPG